MMKKLILSSALGLALLAGCETTTSTDWRIDTGCPYGDITYCEDWPDNGVWNPPETTKNYPDFPYSVPGDVPQADSL